jgi:predicted transposase/invertase (TIGR01784 family)
LKNEHLGRSEEDRRAVFDLYCENERGEKFIVEIQKTKQKFFKDRALYYSTFPISEQAQAGDWNFELKAVYTVAILDFIFDADEAEPEKMRYDVKLSDIATNKVFYDKLTFIYLEMPKFNKTVDELGNRFEKWLYVLKNLERLHKIPAKFQDRLFKKLFAAAEIAKLSPEEARNYEDSLKVYRDMKNSLDTAREEGREEGVVLVAVNLVRMGLPVEEIVKATGLSVEAVDNLRKKEQQVKEPAAKYRTRKKKPPRKKS